jgi:hypothetical protein
LYRKPEIRRGRAVNDLPFSTLLYRYFFFGWLFKDVGEGNLFERAAVVRHNRRQAAWLPTYLLRWLWCALVFYGFGGLFDVMLESPLAGRWCYALSAMCVSFAVMVVTAWIGLTQKQESL